MGQIISFIAGNIFAVGLVISGMTNPRVVIGFLDIFGQWNYSLVFVMAGAVIFNFISFKFLLKRKPLCNIKHYLPEKKEIDKKLVIGSALFGLGWGLIGICPGPGIVNLVTLEPSAILFVISMYLGMLIFQYFERKGVLK